jgi:hypothetical protein
MADITRIRVPGVADPYNIKDSRIEFSFSPTLTGSIVTFNSQYAGLPLKSHKVNIDSVSGVSDFTVYHSAKGLFAYNFSNYTFASNSITVTADYKNTIHLTGTYAGSIAASAWSYNKKATANYGNFIPFREDTSFHIENGSYTLSVNSENASNFRIFILIGDSTNYGQTYADSQPSLQKYAISPNNNITFTVGEGKRIAVMTEVRGLSTGITIDFNLSIQIEKNSEATSIEAISGQHIEIGSTVNEATYNARTGVMEVTQPTEQTIQLPPCPIDTLEGVNNIWADTGDTTLQYVSNISPLMYDVVDYVDDSLLAVAYNNSQEMIEFTQLQ